MNRPPFTEDEICPKSDPYAARQIWLMSKMGSMADEMDKLKADRIEQQAEISTLRSLLLETLELLDQR